MHKTHDAHAEVASEHFWLKLSNTQRFYPSNCSNARRITLPTTSSSIKIIFQSSTWQVSFVNLETACVHLIHCIAASLQWNVRSSDATEAGNLGIVL